MDTSRSVRVEIRSCKYYNEQLIESKERVAKAQENQVEVNAVILQSFSYLHKHGQLGTSHGDRQEEKTNGEDGS